MSKLEAVIFDYDGVLGETMELNFSAWQSAFRERGAEITRDDYFLLEGNQIIEVARILAQKNCMQDADYNSIVLAKEKNFRRNGTVPLYPGVKEFIELLKQKGKKRAVVSAAYYDRLASTNEPGFLDNFDVIVTGDRIIRGKPHPDPYLKAVEALGLSVDNCVVVENSPIGIQSAKAAGMYCIGICSTLHRKYLHQADVVVDKFSDLINLELFRF